MNYSVIKCVNGNFAIASEHGSNLEGAKNSWDSLNIAHRNAQDVLDATIAIVDQNLNIVGKYSEYIHHDPQPEPIVTPSEPEEPIENEGE